ncbi:MAG: hypothetical protein CSB44_00735 [Gammaproteobacteria bacterium]|nr:MAG: hypothetical protein CSB44_00735 [Gammaproteobacteria bacterium]
MTTTGKERKLFFTLWTINGLLMLGLLLLGVLSFAVTIGPMLVDILRPEEHDGGLETPGKTLRRTEALDLEDGIHSPGTPFVRMELVSNFKDVGGSGVKDAIKGSSGGYYRGGSTRNVVFVNMLSNEHRWLFADNEQIISRVQGISRHKAVDRDDLSAVMPDEGSGAAEQLVHYHVIDEDSNGDGIIDTDDEFSLAVSRPDGSQYTVLVDHVQHLLSIEWADDETLFIVYRKDNRPYMARLQTASLRMSAGELLPLVDEPETGSD